MSPQLKTFLIFCTAALTAVWMGGQVASEDYLLPTLAAFACVAAVLTRMLRLPLDTILLGMVAFGYLVGNRGFAQLMPARGLPLLPGEATLLIAGSWAFIACAYEKRLPWRNDALNWTLLLWIVAGSARIFFDVRVYGFSALRDFATVYYAAFFFLAQRVAGNSEPARRYLVGCVVLGSMLLPILSTLYDIVPEFFHTIRVHGIPLLLYKGDLALMFTAAGAVLIFHWATGRNRYWAWPYAVALFVMVLMRESRASIVGSGVVLAMHAAARRWIYPAVQFSAVAVGVVLILALVVTTNNSWANQKLRTVEAHLSSIVDPVRGASAGMAESGYKWDNNRFRLVWWRTLVLETIERNPVFGLGFGYDIARNFVQEYNPEMADDFTARSPHNIALTAFGRMGAIGLAIWLFFVVTVTRKAWRAIRHDPDPLSWGIWSALVVILITAHFQVVLEGPMGAVPFWILLGLAHASDNAAAASRQVKVPA